MDLHRPRSPLLTYGTYPLLVVVTAAAVLLALDRRYDQSMMVVALELVAIVVTGLVEWRSPLRPQWRMTRRSFLGRDLPFLGAGIVVVRFAEAVGLLIAARLVADGGFGPLADAPLVVQVVLSLLVFDLLWYGYHRFAHSNPRLWRVHGAHHAPGQVYVLMHPVFHPIDLIVSRLVIALVVFRLSGITPDSAFVAVVILNLQQMVSHVNADLRVGPLNYVVVGAETHRFHHSAGDRANFGSVVAVWDLLFGSFLYQPHRVPERLGLDDPATFPNPEHFWQTLAWPLRRATRPRTAPQDHLGAAEPATVGSVRLEP